MEIRRGLEGVVVDSTAISLVDGENGILSYRGVPVEDLVALPFPDVASLVVDGAIDESFAEMLIAESELSARELALVLSLPADTHPMHVLQGLTPLLDRTRAFGEHSEAAQGFAIAAKMPALLAAFYRQAAPAPATHRDTAVRFLEAIEAPTTAVAIDAYRAIQILQLEHSFNASTFVARACASTLAPVENALSAAFGTLHGRLHGGADQAALETADAVGAPDRAASFVDQCLLDGTKVMGMGHREYRVVDPRAVVLKDLAHALTAGTEHAITFETLQAIEARFTERMAEQGKRLYANLEFYKGVVYRALGLPDRMFTANFAMARVFGYIAHFIESRVDNRIVRPAAHYIGPEVPASFPPTRASA
jgi:citrate synthase